jgi:hypothetical protein
MRKIKLFSIVIILISISACSSRTGILVEVSDGTKPLIGEAVATLSSGTFEVSNLDGYSCNGTYDQWSESKMLKVKVKCNDDRHGNAIILRTGKNLMNGSGEGKLNDGTTFKIWLGDMVHYRNAQGFFDKAK